MIVAAHGWPGWSLLGLIVGCMVFARTAAMSFNRIVDWEIDQRNPRTAHRHQLLKKREAIFFSAGSSILFLITAWRINPPCAFLAPVALIIIFFYSLTKRFTHFAPFFLGLALAISPLGSWIAVQGTLSLAPLILALGVLCWVAGFDIIYATQDEDIDRQEGLYSMVVLLGVTRALTLAKWLHFLLFVFLIAFGIMSQQHRGYYFFLAPVLLLLFYEHKIAATLQVSLLNRAFFQTNALLGFLFLIATYAGL